MTALLILSAAVVATIGVGLWQISHAEMNDPTGEDWQ